MLCCSLNTYLYKDFKVNIDVLYKYESVENNRNQNVRYTKIEYVRINDDFIVTKLHLIMSEVSTSDFFRKVSPYDVFMNI